MTKTPTLPPDWVPTQADCLSPSDIWIWDYRTDENHNRTVLGGPSQTSNCFPPTWVSTGEYIGTQCPPQYTAACRATDSIELVTCCPMSEPQMKQNPLLIKTSLTSPSVYNFGCVGTHITQPHGSLFRCISQYTTSGLLSVTLTDFVANTLAVGVVSEYPTRHLFALAMVYAAPVCTLNETFSVPCWPANTSTEVNDRLR